MTYHNSIESLLEAIGLTGYEAKLEYEGDDYKKYKVLVPEELADKACEAAQEHTLKFGYLSIESEPPPLVHAELGQVVQISNEKSYFDECFGVVTSKQVIDGEVYYGCSYIFPQIGQDTIYRFTLTKEDYGGYHHGFLRVVPFEEVPAVLEQIIQKEYDNAIKRIEEDKIRAKEKIKDLIDTLRAGEVRTVEQWFYPIDGCLSVDSKISEGPKKFMQ